MKKKIKLLLLSSVIDGGAGKAVLKIYRLLKKSDIIEPKILILNYTDTDKKIKNIDKSDIFIINNNFLKKLILKSKILTNKFIINILGKKSIYFQNIDLFNSSIVNKINKSDIDVVQLNWINNLISLKEISKISKPLIWRFSDMWPFIGSEHYTDNIEKYYEQTVVLNNSFFNLDNYVYRKKLKYLKNLDFEIIAPSKWMKNTAKKCKITVDKKIHLLKTPIDTKFFKKIDKITARKKLNLNQNHYIILFSSLGGINDKRKGWKFLKASLEKLSDEGISASILLIGQDFIELQKIKNINFIFFGKITDESLLPYLYSSADVTAIPSLNDNLPQVGIESLSCGTPLVTFHNGGNSDLVDHKITGYLAKHKNIQEFTDGLVWIKKQKNISKKIHSYVKKNYDQKIILKSYERIYKELNNKYAIKPIIFSSSDTVGGAQRAAYRVVNSQVNNNIKSSLYVNRKFSDDKIVYTPINNFVYIQNRLRSFIGTLISNYIAKKTNKINFYSVNFINSPWPKLLNNTNSNIIDIHWFGAESLSIKDINKIKKNLVFTLHDMWAFGGIEHYDSEYLIDLLGKNKSQFKYKFLGFDINKWTINRKIKYWKKSVVISPSNWLAKQIKKSRIMKNWDIKIIPYPINLNVFKPLDKNLSRKILNLNKRKKIILFGAIGGTTDLRKGFDLFYKCIDNLNDNSIEILIFGQSKPKNFVNKNIKINWLGEIKNDHTLSLVYNSSDVMVVPSRIDNLPQTAMEAQSCGLPVVGFNTSGMEDVVLHGETGFLVQPFDIKMLSEKILYLTKNNKINKNFSEKSAIRAKKLWNQKTVSNQYKKVYEEVILQNSKSFEKLFTEA